MVKLDIGGYGNDIAHKRDHDYIAVSLHPESNIRASMWDLPFKNESVDFIWSSHTLEHAPIRKVHETLKEWFRVLRPGRKAIVAVPNFDYVARYWLTGPDRNWAEAMVYGLQSDQGEYHKCAFTSQGLKADLEAAGFDVKRVELRWAYNQETLQAVVVKPLVPKEQLH